jgi:hypothetical protein
VTGIWFGLSLLKGAAMHQTAQNADEDWCCKFLVSHSHFVLADGIRDPLAHVPGDIEPPDPRRLLSLTRSSCITTVPGTRNGDDHLHVDFGFGTGCFSFNIQSRKFGAKFPQNLQTTEFF